MDQEFSLELTAYADINVTVKSNGEIVVHRPDHWSGMLVRTDTLTDMKTINSEYNDYDLYDRIFAAVYGSSREIKIALSSADATGAELVMD